MQDTDVKDILKRHSGLKTDRGPWENHWQELKELVRPNTSNFTGASSQGDHRTLRIYDGTALWALEQFAAGLNSFLTNPSSRWFNLSVMDEELVRIPEVLYWLEIVSDVIFRTYSSPTSSFNPAIHECYLDIGAFGTTVLYQDYDRQTGDIYFKTFPLADCVIAENHQGIVDTLFRSVTMTERQVIQEFVDLPPKMAEKSRTKPDLDREWTIIHAVFPRKDRDTEKLVSTHMRYASLWICEETQELIKESGFQDFPYHAPRWTKLAGEMYGRSPAMTCLPDIKMVNQMSFTVIKAAQKVVDPPLMAPDDGFMLPIRTSPGALIFYEAGLNEKDRLVPLETKGNIQIGLEMMNQRRDHILKSFFVDWLIREKKRERQTTTEIQDDREEMLRQMAPMLGRLQSEMHGPMISRTYGLLVRTKRVPPPPTVLAGRELKLEYVSAASRAQFSTKAMSIQRFIQDIAPMASIQPDIMDNIDSDQFASEMASLRDVSRKIIRPMKDVAQLRQERNKKQAQAEQAAIGRERAAASKDTSEAMLNMREQ